MWCALKCHLQESSRCCGLSGAIFCTVHGCTVLQQLPTPAMFALYLRSHGDLNTLRARVRTLLVSPQLPGLPCACPEPPHRSCCGWQAEWPPSTSCSRASPTPGSPGLGRPQCPPSMPACCGWSCRRHLPSSAGRVGQALPPPVFIASSGNRTPASADHAFWHGMLT